MGVTREQSVQSVARLLGQHDVLADLSRRLGPAYDLQLTVETVLGAMRRLVTFRGGSICLAEDGYVHMVACDPQASREVLEARIPVGSGIAGRIVAEGRTISVPDLDCDERVDPALRWLGSNAGMRSYLGVPLVSLGEVIGVLQIDSASPHAFDGADVETLEWLAAHVSGAIGSARNIDQARELDLLKNDFIERVSHELRTPLTVIRGFVATLLDGRVDADQHTAILRRTAAHAARLEDLIEDLLALSSVEAGTSRPLLVETPVTALLAGLGDDVDVESPAPTVTVRTDATLLRRALGELVTNARSFAGSSRVRVLVDVHERVVIEVADEGPGIPPEILGHASERFVRGPDTRPGLGLGLYRVQRIADALSAEFTLDASEAGTTARLHLPT